VNTFAHSPAQQLEMNGIASVEFEATEPLFFDSYRRNRTTGSFIVIDPVTNATVGAGMIQDALSDSGKSIEALAVQSPVTQAERARRHGHRPAIILVNDLDRAKLLERALFENRFEVAVVDAEQFAPEALLASARVLLQVGIIVLVAAGNLTEKNRRALQPLASDSTLDLSREDASLSDEQSIQRILLFAQDLRVIPQSNNTDEAH